MADGIEVVRELADPVGAVTESWTRPNGMTIERVRVPLGVIGVIYESRPNVTADAAVLCLKAGNAVILRGGSESFRSARAIHAALVEGLRAADLPEDAIQLVPTRDRAAVGMMLAGLDGAIDVIVPRGGKGLVARVQAEARVPVFAHLEGVVHVYVDKAADLDMAKDHRAERQDAPHRRLRRRRDAADRSRRRADACSSRLSRCCIDAGCEVRGDADVQKADSRAKAASEDDWPAEYLDAIIAAKVVDGVDAAIAHIERYGSHHTDAIVTADQKAADKFLSEVDSRDRAAQRLDAIRRRRRVRLRRRDRHRDGPHARARPGRRRAAHHVQVSHPRHGADASPDAADSDPGPACPAPAPGCKIGLFGGTFDPPHAAHRAACLLAMQRLNLDRVWWLVTPGNPLKDTRGLAAARRAHRGGEDAREPSAHHRHRRRGRDAHALHLRHVAHAHRALPRRALRLDHGRRQSAQLPSLAEVARHRRPRADRGRRPRRPEPLRDRRPRRAGALALPHSGAARKVAAAPQAARLGLPARAEVAALLHGAARAAPEIDGRAHRLRPVRRDPMLIFYALEDRSPWFILAFAGACALGSVYGFLQGAWPFGVIEAIWAGWRHGDGESAAHDPTHKPKTVT